MKQYIAFLRGINVSGKNKISMPILREVFAAAGFTKVKTYINSGNILFSAPQLEPATLVELCQQIILAEFDLAIPVAIISVEELQEVVAHAPEWWTTDKEIVTYAIFLLPPLTVTEVVEAVGEIDPQYEQLSVYQNVIFWSTPLKTFNKSRWSKIASSAVNRRVTIRNSRTVLKMLELAE